MSVKTSTASLEPAAVLDMCGLFSDVEWPHSKRKCWVNLRNHPARPQGHSPDLTAPVFRRYAKGSRIPFPASMYRRRLISTIIDITCGSTPSDAAGTSDPEKGLSTATDHLPYEMRARLRRAAISDHESGPTCHDYNRVCSIPDATYGPMTHAMYGMSAGSVGRNDAHEPPRADWRGGGPLIARQPDRGVSLILADEASRARSQPLPRSLHLELRRACSTET